MIQSINRPNLFARTLLGRRVLVAITLLLTYGGGLWLYLLHEVEGATEPNAPPGVIHWLRDSTLSLPLVALGVFLGAALARGLLGRYGRNASAVMVGALVAVVLAFYASVVLSVGNPIHGQLFASSVHGGGHDLPVGIHVVRDGLLALSANEVLAVVVAAVVLGRQLLLAPRRAAIIEPS
jgi:Na+/H+-dicarboxylate symporter